MRYYPRDFGLISIVIPLYNEVENVRPLVMAIDGAMQGYYCEILLINDGSTDGTEIEIQQLNHPKIKLVNLQKNQGQSLALAAGLELAKGEYIVTMDGDLQNDPIDIPWMLSKAKAEQWDLVTGIRQQRKDSFLKTLPSRVANYIIRKATNINLRDQGCGLKVFTYSTAKKLHLYDQMHRYIPLIIHLSEGRILQVPVRHNPRLFGSSKYGLERIFKVIYDLVVLMYRHRLSQKYKKTPNCLRIKRSTNQMIFSLFLIYKKKFQTRPKRTTKSR